MQLMALLSTDSILLLFSSFFRFFFFSFETRTLTAKISEETVVLLNEVQCPTAIMENVKRPSHPPPSSSPSNHPGNSVLHSTPSKWTRQASSSSSTTTTAFQVFQTPVPQYATTRTHDAPNAIGSSTQNTQTYASPASPLVIQQWPTYSLPSSTYHDTFQQTLASSPSAAPEVPYLQPVFVSGGKSRYFDYLNPSKPALVALSFAQCNSVSHHCVLKFDASF